MQSSGFFHANAPEGFDVPVLLIVFNRPDATRLLIERLRVLGPRRLYVFGDGPRADVPEDPARCAATREAIGAIDWPCSVRKLHMTENLGCVRSVLSAVTWFFQQVPAGIILEDDCIPSNSFFPFCQMLLERYGQDERVFHISGWSPHRNHGHATYRFDRYMYCWGWASWARAWKNFAFAFPDIDAFLERGGLRDFFDEKTEAYLGERLRLPRRLSETWDIRWLYSILRCGGYCVTPAVNLIQNIGCPAGSPAHDYPAVELNVGSMTHPSLYDVWPSALGI